MTPEERVAQLETKFVQMQTAYTEATDLMQHLGGSERVFQAAVLAMIQTHPNKAALLPALQEMVEKATNAVLFDSQSESHLKGAQDAREVIQVFFDNK